MNQLKLFYQSSVWGLSGAVVPGCPRWRTCCSTRAFHPVIIYSTKSRKLTEAGEGQTRWSVQISTQTKLQRQDPKSSPENRQKRWDEGTLGNTMNWEGSDFNTQGTGGTNQGGADNQWRANNKDRKCEVGWDTPGYKLQNKTTIQSIVSQQSSVVLYDVIWGVWYLRPFDWIDLYHKRRILIQTLKIMTNIKQDITEW